MAPGCTRKSYQSMDPRVEVGPTTREGKAPEQTAGGGSGTGKFIGEEVEDPVTSRTFGCSLGEAVLSSLGSPTPYNNKRSSPRVLPNATEGLPPEVSEFPEAGFQFISPASWTSAFARKQKRATLEVRPWHVTVTPVSPMSRISPGPCRWATIAIVNINFAKENRVSYLHIRAKNDLL